MIFRCKPLMEFFQDPRTAPLLLDRAERECAETVKKFIEFNARKAEEYRVAEEAYQADFSMARNDVRFNVVEEMLAPYSIEQLADPGFGLALHGAIEERARLELEAFDRVNRRPRKVVAWFPIRETIFWSEGLAPPASAGDDVVLKRRSWVVFKEVAQSVRFLCRKPVPPPVFLDLTDSDLRYVALGH